MRFYQKSDYPLRIYIEGNEFEINRLTASFANKFYKDEDNYSHEEDITNIIFDQDSEYYFPVGLLSVVKGELLSLKIPLEGESLLNDYEEDEECKISSDILEGVTLRDYQVKGVQEALKRKRGLLQLATGAGKTELMIAISKFILDNKEGHILLCVPTATLLHQAYDRMILRGIPESEISRYGDGHKIDTNKRIVISTVQTAYRRLEDDEFKAWYANLECIMLDEAQHCACRTWYTLIDKVAPEYILGLSAEPFYGDKDHLARDLILRGTVGPVLYRISLNYLIERGYLSKPYMIAVDTQYNGNIYKVMDWHVVNKNGIVNNKLRNEVIRDTAWVLIDMNKNPLILVQQINHGVILAKMISMNSRKVAILTGGLKVSIYSDGMLIDTYKDSDNQVKEDFQKGRYDALIGTSVLDEGADIPALSSVILAGGSKSKLRLIQRIGRGLRCQEGKYTTIIIDFQDRFSIILNNHHKKRAQVFKDNNVPIYYCTDTNNLEGFVASLEKQRRIELGLQEVSS